mgnify:CR=1 FL=1
MVARVRGSCNKEQEIRMHLEKALEQAKVRVRLKDAPEEAKDVVLKVDRKGANFIIEFRNKHERMQIPAMLVQLIGEAISNLIRKLRLSLDRHSSDGFHVTYKLASS